MDSFLSLKLRCRLCDSADEYEVAKIFINPKRASFPPYIGDTLVCSQCKKIAEFDVTEESMASLTKEYLRVVGKLNRGSSAPKYGQGLRPINVPTPLIFVSLRLPTGEQVSPGEALDCYRDRLSSEPIRTVDRLDLGNCWLALEEHKQAQKCFSEAGLLDRTCVEAHLHEAILVEARGDSVAAFTILVRSLKMQKNWRFRRLVNSNPEEFGAAFAALFNRLRRKTRSLQRKTSELRYEPGRSEQFENSALTSKPEVLTLPALHPAFLATRYKGVGRNDACPCGSGKIFRRCCGCE